MILGWAAAGVWAAALACMGSLPLAPPVPLVRLAPSRAFSSVRGTGGRRGNWSWSSLGISLQRYHLRCWQRLQFSMCSHGVLHARAASSVSRGWLVLASLAVDQAAMLAPVSLCASVQPPPLTPLMHVLPGCEDKEGAPEGQRSSKFKLCRHILAYTPGEGSDPAGGPCRPANQTLAEFRLIKAIGGALDSAAYPGQIQ